MWGIALLIIAVIIVLKLIIKKTGSEIEQCDIEQTKTDTEDINDPTSVYYHVFHDK